MHLITVLYIATSRIS